MWTGRSCSLMIWLYIWLYFLRTAEEEYVKKGQPNINPMVDLFYGQYRAEGFNEGMEFDRMCGEIFIH